MMKKLSLFFIQRAVDPVPVLLSERNNPPSIRGIVKDTTQQGGLP